MYVQYVRSAYKNMHIARIETYPGGTLRHGEEQRQCRSAESAGKGDGPPLQWEGSSPSANSCVWPEKQSALRAPGCHQFLPSSVHASCP